MGEVERETTTPAILMTGVSVFFGPRPALDGVTLSVKPGELVALVGENGAGKSTLVSVMSGVQAPDAGTASIFGRDAVTAQRAGDLAVVWQDLALCDNLSVIANLYLGAELGGVFLSRRRMRQQVTGVLRRVGLQGVSLDQKTSDLSGGERQAVAIARALMVNPRVLVLDEPTSALGVQESRRIERLIRSLRDEGVTVILVSHNIEQVFGLADRVVALRQGRLVGNVSTIESHADDIVALMSGIYVDSVARRHLSRLSSLVDQLADVEPSASLPIIVAAMSTAFGQQQMCIHLKASPTDSSLALGASVGVDEAALLTLREVPIGTAGGSIGEAAQTGLPVIVDDLRRVGGGPIGAGSMWSVPVQGSRGSYGVLSGLAPGPGRPRDDQLRLAEVYASLAATAIEREHLLRDFTRRNRMLESLRSVLAALAGPGQLSASLSGALSAVAAGLGANAAALVEVSSDAQLQVIGAFAVEGDESARLLADELTTASWDEPRHVGVRAINSRVSAVPFTVLDRRFVIGAKWQEPGPHIRDGSELLLSVSGSVRLAVERELAQVAQAEADALRHIGDVQRDFIRRVSHELRTPLTAIAGYAGTLMATDVEWDADSQRRFLEIIAAESERMGRLVTDLLDFSAASTGVMTMHPDWCDLAAVLSAAVHALPQGGDTVRTVVADLPPVWADHDRVQQVVVNLLDNAIKYGGADVTLSAYVEGSNAVIEVGDNGPGIAPEFRDLALEPYVRGQTSEPGAGLGLSISKSLVEAHHGSLRIVDSATGALLRVTLPVDSASEVTT